MPSYKSIGFAAIAFVAHVAGQDTINPEDVPIATRSAWCLGEITTCPIICEQLSHGDAESNECDVDTLEYSCVCANGIVPNVTEYTLTMPFYICTEWGNQCVTACGNDNKCAYNCRADNPCGAQTVASNTTSTGTASVVKETATSTEGAADAINTNVLGGSDDEGAAVRMGREFGLIGLAGSLFTVFMLA